LSITTTRWDAATAADSLLENLDQAGAPCSGNALMCAQALQVGIRCSELMAISALRPVASRFPATIQELFHQPGSSLVALEDAFADPQASLGFLDLLDLASGQGLTCIAPRLYRGWQDKRQARRDARRITSEQLGFALDEGERAGLLASLALRNRVFVLPPPLELGLQEAAEALEHVLALLARLAPDQAQRIAVLRG